MSKYMTTQTALREEKYLVAALSAMGYKPIVHGQPVTLTDYHSNRVQATVVVPKDQLGTAPGQRAWADIGFAKGNDGSYNAFIDDYDRMGVSGKLRYDNAWMGRLSQNYTEVRTMDVAKQKGYSFAGKQMVDGKVKLTFHVQ